ncbi:MAG: hypothetical protein FIB08_09015 [Candidatus Methanoperedens sp.]|nr:hypothetical protein [Candidatus Methanoperedens sp.]
MNAAIGNIKKKLMGWCPLKKADPGIDYVFISDYSYSNKPPASDNTVRKMDVPIQSIYEWRMLAVLLGFIALVLIGSERAGTYMYVFPSFFVYIALVFIFGRSKASIGNGTLKISAPLSKEVLIPKNSIRSMEIIENSASRNKLRHLALLILASMQLVFLLFTLKGPIWTNMFIISIFLWVYILYFSIRIYNNTKIIKINADGGDILLYPRNEHEFLILKEFAENKPI